MAGQAQPMSYSDELEAAKAMQVCLFCFVSFRLHLFCLVFVLVIFVILGFVLGWGLRWCATAKPRPS
jgi:hypothetical protein